MKNRNIRRPPPPQAPLLISGAALNYLILIILIAFSYLREEPIFWRNEGGAPIWLRELVAGYYYPLLLLELFLLSAFSGFSILRLSSRSGSASLAVILLPMMWGLYFMLIANSAFNNLENLFHGRPLHWHPDKTWNPLGGDPPGSSPPAIRIRAIGSGGLSHYAGHPVGDIRRKAGGRKDDQARQRANAAPRQVERFFDRDGHETRFFRDRCQRSAALPGKNPGLLS